MVFARVERHQRSGRAIDGLTRSVDRDAAGDDVQNRALAHVVIG
jgi:hypothetical protein